MVSTLVLKVVKNCYKRKRTLKERERGAIVGIQEERALTFGLICINNPERKEKTYCPIVSASGLRS